MAARVIPMVRKEVPSESREDWKAPIFEYLSERLDEIVSRGSMDRLIDITSTIFAGKAEIMGQLILAVIKKRHQGLVEQEHCSCPRCARLLKRRGLHKRQVETMAGAFELERPYFYCVDCRFGFYPIDEALGLSPSAKQYDVVEVAAWLATELPHQVASEAFGRCTGMEFSAHSMHECVHAVARETSFADICPSQAEVEAKIAAIAEGKRCRPVMMMTIDGAKAPVRPEPSARKGKRGKGDWREAKGFRLYLIDKGRIEHLVSWHEICSDQELAETIRAAKEAGLIPENRVRLCVVADGAAWIWNRVEELFPRAKQVLDFYHCAEHLHAVAAAQYGKGTPAAHEWVEATLLRLFLKQKKHVIAGLKRMKPKSAEAGELIVKTTAYLTKHAKRIDYGTARRGGYHIGSGAMESSNKLICHGRLKRPGAWWYPSHANNILKLRCAKQNRTYSKVIDLFRERHRVRIVRRSQSVEPRNTNKEA